MHDAVVAGEHCLAPKHAADKIAVVIEANTSPAAVPVKAITIPIESCTAEEAGAHQSSKTDVGVKESTVEKCDAQEDSAEQCPGKQL